MIKILSVIQQVRIDAVLGKYLYEKAPEMVLFLLLLKVSNKEWNLITIFLILLTPY
jgi:hypothetical protein